MKNLYLETRDRIKDRATRVILKALSYSGRAWRNAPYTSDTPAIIIGGCQRSGTTLMRVILDSHPNICCGPESDLFLPRPIFIKRLAFRFDLDESLIRKLRENCPSRSEFIDRIFKAYCDVSGKPRWAEKSPPNIYHLDYIYHHFPKAKFIHMIRDGRDTVCSLRVHPRHKVVNGQLVKRNTRNPIDICAREWVNSVRAGMKWRGDDRYLEVRYEDLTTSAEPTVRNVVEFLGEPWTDAMLNFHKSDNASRDVTKFPQNPEATKAIYTTAVQKWRNDLSSREIQTVKRIAGDLLIELGYEKDHRWAS